MTDVQTQSSTGEAAPKPAGKPKPVKVAGQVVGILGIIVSIVLVVGVLLGRGWVIGQVDAVAATVDAGLARADPVLLAAETKVGDVKTRVEAMVQAADAVAANPAPPPALTGALSGAISAVTDRYASLRSGYSDAREGITSTIAQLQGLVRFIPGVSVPQGPIDALAALDTKVRALDSTLSGVFGGQPGSQAIGELATAVSAKGNELLAGLDTVASAINQVQGTLAQARADAAGIASTIDSVMTILTVVIVLLFVYIALLHWVLFRTSRAAGRPAA